MSTIEGRRVLITGASGFTGQYVSDALVNRGYAIACPPTPIDLTDRDALRAIIAETEFDEVIHLAAISFVGHADAGDFYRINTVGTTNLLEAIATANRDVGRIVLASSANIYGNNPQSPIEEDARPAPVNHYAASKVAMELMAQLWRDRLPIVVTRPFNYTGVGQRGEFLIPKIVRHFVERHAVIELGNIDVIRDFSDVRDVAAAYVALLNAPAGTVVNICSGVGTSLRSVIDHCSSTTGHEIDVRVNPAFVRSDEIRQLIGSNRRLSDIVGVEGRRSFAQTLDWMLGTETA
jgi:nucleoside-diphosphate-sugar epimerase